MTLRELYWARRCLGVRSNASKTDIKRAFKRLAVENHPDKWKPDCGMKYSLMMKRWRAILDSYRILKDYNSPYQKNRYKNGFEAKRWYALVPITYYNEESRATR